MKLLVATEFPPDAAGGGAAIVRQMLQGFPGEISWWSVNPAKSKEFEGVGIVKSYCGFPPGKLMPQKRFSRLKSWLMAHVWTPIAARDFKRTLEIEQPDCVWVILHNWSILPIHQVLVGWTESAKRGRWRGHFHTSMHDYVDVHGFGKRFGCILEEGMRLRQNELYQMSVTRDVICQQMGDNLELLTKASPDFICRKGVNLSTIPSVNCNLSVGNKNAVIRIAYAGSILVPKDFEQWILTLDKISKSIPMELHLYGAHDYSSASWFRPWMVYHGNMNEEDLIKELALMDWGVCFMSLKDLDPTYNRYSFPAKFSTYLSAGLPVITVGHPESSVMKMAEDYDVGVNLSNFESESLQSLGVAIADPNAKSHYRPEIIRCAKEQFDGDKMRYQLWNVFQKESR